MDLYKSSIYRISKDTKKRQLLIFGYNETAKKILRKLYLIDIVPLGFLVSSLPEGRDNSETILEAINDSTKIKVAFYTYEDLKNIDLNEIRIIMTNPEQAKELEGIGLIRGENFRSVAYHESTRQEYKMDPTLGYNLITEKEIPGFKQFGSLLSENVIVTLGNSTTDPKLFPFKSWSELLGEKIKQKNLDLKILCGAVSGHTSAQELLKLMRDVIPMRPKMVICYEGFQDMNLSVEEKAFKFILPYQKEWLSSLNINRWINIYFTKGYTLGVDDNLTCYQAWKKNMRMMHAICEEFGIKFIGILQPSLFNKYPNYGKHDWEVVLHYELRGNYMACFKEFFDEYDRDQEKLEYVYDYTDIFHAIDGIYIDNCHVYEKGNHLIAEKIFADFLDGKGFER